MVAVTQVLLGDTLPHLDFPAPDRSTRRTISDVRRVHSLQWKCFDVEEPLVSWTYTSHRTSNVAAQKKRKRKDSDGEYTPHQRADNNNPVSSTTRRTSKRLAAFSQPPPLNTRPHRTTFATKRSSSSTSAVTSASSSSFERLPTPKDPDASDLPQPTSKPERSRPKRCLEVEYIYSDDSSDHDPSDSYSSPISETEIFTPVKIGFPSKIKKTVKVSYMDRLVPHTSNAFFRTIFATVDSSPPRRSPRLMFPTIEKVWEVWEAFSIHRRSDPLHPPEPPSPNFLPRTILIRANAVISCGGKGLGPLTGYTRGSSLQLRDAIVYDFGLLSYPSSPEPHRDLTFVHLVLLVYFLRY